MVEGQNYFKELDELHLKLSNVLKYSSKDCSDCIDCCVNLSEGFIFIPLYVDYINYNLSKDNKTYKPLTWEEALGINLCPYLNLKKNSCDIYTIRPLVCRLYPRLLEKSESSLYEKCAFYEEYEFSDFDRNIPYIDEIESINKRISELNIEYLKKHSMERLKQYKEFVNIQLAPEAKIKRNIEIYKKALEISPNSLSIIYHLAKIYINLGENALAIKELDRAIEIEKSNYRARIMKAKIYEMESRLDDAITTLNETIEINPSLPQGHYILGIIYLIKENYNHAYEKFMELLKIHPKAIFKYENLKELINLAIKNRNSIISVFISIQSVINLWEDLLDFCLIDNFLTILQYSQSFIA